MKPHVNLCFILFIILRNQYYIIEAKPLIGPNVRNAEENEFPFIVALVYYFPNNPEPETNHICTGSLITRKDVATSAHCVLDENINTVQIHYGSNDLRGDHKHYIYWWITYDGWANRENIDLTFDVNDVANIRLLQPVSSSIIPVPLSNMINVNLYGRELTIAGWSWINTTAVDRILKTARVMALSNDECVRRISDLADTYLPIDDSHGFCSVGDPYVLVYYGDSGGPILYNNELVGINQGTCPDNIQDDDPNLVNFHMAMQFYKHFFLEMIDWFEY